MNLSAKNIGLQILLGVIVGLFVMVLADWMRQKGILFPPVADNSETNKLLGIW